FTMRVALIICCAIPAILSLTCYSGVGNETESDSFNELPCDRLFGSQFCFIEEFTADGERSVSKSCGKTGGDFACTRSGCIIQGGVLNLTSCCCEGDMCNDSVAAIEKAEKSTTPVTEPTPATTAATTPVPSPEPTTQRLTTPTNECSTTSGKATDSSILLVFTIASVSTICA
ncbi:hypothetical protein PMAYCL1PPCAC_22195, partial [Pristionchus mayeri]